MRKATLHAWILSLAVLATACSFGPAQTRDPGAPGHESATSEPPPTADRQQGESPQEAPIQAPQSPPKQPTASGAVIALLDTARQQAAAGHDEQAAASLERALRIEPKNPWLWHRLGVLRLQQGKYQAAIDLASKSNTLAAGDRRLMGGNWELIARAYSALGNTEAAERARRNARQLQGETAGTS